MSKEKFVKRLEDFKIKISEYRDLLLRSRDSMMPEVVRNHKEVAAMRSELNKMYGGLEKYIKKFSRNPMYIDPVWKIPQPAYETAFSTDILLRVGPCIDSALTDLDYVVGKVDTLKEDEFNITINPEPINRPTVNAQGGQGGHGGNGPGGGHGGHGGSGGSAVFMQAGKEFTSEGITIKDVKSPHKQYWKFVFANVWKSIKENKGLSAFILLIIAGLIVAYLAHHFGWNK